MAIKIYGDIDRRADGHPRGFKPSWAEKHALENLTEEIEGTQRQLDRGLIPSSEVYLAQERIRKGKERLDVINKSKPKLSDAQKDEANKERNRVGAMISDGLFTHTEMDMGFADPHEEVARMTEKKLALDPEQAKESGVTLVDGKGSRKDAEKIFQHLSYALGESPDIEKLRKAGKRGPTVKGKKGAFDN